MTIIFALDTGKRVSFENAEITGRLHDIIFAQGTVESFTHTLKLQGDFTELDIDYDDPTPYLGEVLRAAHTIKMFGPLIDEGVHVSVANEL